MNRTRTDQSRVLLIASILSLALVCTAAATAAEKEAAPPPAQGYKLDIMQADQLIGMPVRDAWNNDLGAVDDIAVDTERGCIAYLIAAAPAKGDQPERFAMAPWYALRFMRRGYIVAAETTPPQDPFGTEPAIIIRASQIIGTNVKDNLGADVGQIENVVFDGETGMLGYAILSLDAMGLSGRRAAVPWSALDITRDRTSAGLDADQRLLKSIAHTPKEAPDLSDLDYGKRLYTLFDRMPCWQEQLYAAGGEGSAWAPGSDFNSRFDPAKLETFQATIESVGSFRPDCVSAQGLRLRVATGDKSLIVYGGPRAYARRLGFRLGHNQDITVTGSLTKIGALDVLLASNIRTGARILPLRDRDGRPLWTSADYLPTSPGSPAIAAAQPQIQAPGYPPPGTPSVAAPEQTQAPPRIYIWRRVRNVYGGGLYNQYNEPYYRSGGVPGRNYWYRGPIGYPYLESSGPGYYVPGVWYRSGDFFYYFAPPESQSAPPQPAPAPR